MSALFYDWHNNLVLRRQNADIEYFKYQVEVLQPHNILVVGAGTGRIAIPLSVMAEVTALDIDRGRLELLAAKSPKVQTILADITELTTQQRYDMAIAPYSTLQCISKALYRNVFTNVLAALNQNGVFIVDLSSSFNQRQNSDWEQALNEDCTELGTKVLEENRNVRGPEYISIYKRFTNSAGMLLVEFEEQWNYYDHDEIIELITNSGFKLRKVDNGYLNGGSKHRFIFHCEK